MEISIRPADGKQYRNGAIVGHVVPLGEVAHTIEALMGATTSEGEVKTSRVAMLAQQLNEMTERLAQAGYRIKDLENDRAAADTALEGARDRVTELERDLVTERDRAEGNREWAEREAARADRLEQGAKDHRISLQARDNLLRFTKIQINEVKILVNTEEVLKDLDFVKDLSTVSPRASRFGQVIAKIRTVVNDERPDPA